MRDLARRWPAAQNADSNAAAFFASMPGGERSGGEPRRRGEDVHGCRGEQRGDATLCCQTLSRPLDLVFLAGV